MNNDNLYMKIKDEFRKQKTIGEIQHQFMTYDKLQSILIGSQNLV